jgi:D-aminopeptidase
VTKVNACHRAAQGGISHPGSAGIPAFSWERRHPACRAGARNYINKKKQARCLRSQSKQMLSAAFTDDSTAQWFALLALIYGAAIMSFVIVALMKSARKRRAEALNKR